MQRDKFERAVAASSQLPSTSTPVINSPVQQSYWKHKFEQAMKAYSKNSEQSLQIEDVPGLIKIPKVKPKTPKENVRVTVYGSMEGKQILEKVADKLEKEKAKKRREVETSREDKCILQYKLNCVWSKAM